MNNALTIAGSDSSGGAGIQADLKTFSANGVYGMSVITSVTAQNTQGVFYVQDLEIKTIVKQIEAVLDDIKIESIKIGMVSRIPAIEAIRETLDKYKLPSVVLDPVMISKSGYKLLSDDAIKVLIDKLFPISDIITPNIPEAEVLVNRRISSLEDMKDVCKDLIKLGPSNVLLKGGHLESSAVDILYDGINYYKLDEEKINTKHTHGTGCTLSSAIAANLSKGQDILDAVINAKKYVTGAIKHGFALGKGVGPTNHFFEFCYKVRDNNE